jgi:hypothetical protein
MPPEIDPAVEDTFLRAGPHVVVTVVFELYSLTAEDQDAQVPDAMFDAGTRRAAIERHKRAQLMRYGETLTRIRALVSTNLRGPNDLPTSNRITVWGPARKVEEASQFVAKVLPADAPHTAA